LFDSIKQWRTRRQWQKSELGLALREHTQEFFYRGQALAHFSDQAKERLIGDFHQQVFEVLGAENPVDAQRHKLTSYVLELAPMQILSMDENDKANHPIYTPCPYISGTIYQHISDVADEYDELKKLKWEEPDTTDQDLFDYCRGRSTVLLYFANGMNIVRISMGDESDPDWYKPFVEAQLVAEEARIREKLELPQLTPNDMDSLIYGMFFEYVLAGDQNPFYSWSDKWPDHRLADRGLDA